MVGHKAMPLIRSQIEDNVDNKGNYKKWVNHSYINFKREHNHSRRHQWDFSIELESVKKISENKLSSKSAEVNNQGRMEIHT